jgi:hypothetical protein
MEKSRIKGTTEMKSAAQLWAEEEARVVIAKEKAAVAARAAAKAKAEDEIWNAGAKERARIKAVAAAEARAAEEARITAAASDEWFYLRNGEQIGPVSLVGLKEKIADLSIEPPLKMVWTAGMDGWKPVYEVRKLCESLPSHEAEIHLDFNASDEVVNLEADHEEQVRAAAEAAAAEAAWLAAAAQSEAKARAQDAEEARIAAAQNARVKAAEEAKLKAAEEAKVAAAAKAQAEEIAKAKAEEEAALRAAAEAKAAEMAKLLAAAETKAAEEARIAAAAKAKAEEEAVAKAIAEAKLKAAEEACARAEAKAIAAAKMAAAATLKAEEEVKARREAKAAEEARIAAAAKRKAAEDAEAAAEMASLAAEEARVMAAAKLRAEIAAAKAKARREKRTKAAENAKVRTLARTRAAEKSRSAEAMAKATEDVSAPVEQRKFGQVSSKNCWFYTCQGERLGPVKFEELRKMAVDLSLDPRLDMVWRQSMDAWKPAGRIDGLFERNNVLADSSEQAPPAALPTGPPRQSARKPTPGRAKWPGGRRRSFLLATLILPFAWQHALAAASPFLINRFGPAIMGPILPYAAFAPLVLLLHMGVGRLVNLGMSRLWCLAVLAPGINLWLGYRCFACPPGYAFHQKLDGRGIALAMAYWLVMLAAVLALAACVGLLSGAIESPLLLKQLRRLI